MLAVVLASASGLAAFAIVRACAPQRELASGNSIHREVPQAVRDYWNYGGGVRVQDIAEGRFPHLEESYQRGLIGVGPRNAESWPDPTNPYPMLFSHTRYPEWKPFQGEWLTHVDADRKRTRYRIIDIGLWQMKLEADLFEPARKFVEATGKRGSFVMWGKKAEGEKHLQDLNYELRRMVVQHYARKRPDRFTSADLAQMLANVSLNDGKRVFVLLKDPPEDLTQLTREKLRECAVATVSLLSMHWEGRTSGIRTHAETASTGRGFPDLHRPFVDEGKRAALESRVEEEYAKTHIWTASKLAKFDPRVPEDVFNALIFKALDAGTQPTEGGRKSRVFFAMDKLTYRAFRHLHATPFESIELIGEPARIYQPLTSEHLHSVEPWKKDEQELQKRRLPVQETIYVLDRENAEQDAAIRELERDYRAVLEGSQSP
jgi:hypothetical protein